MKELIIACVTSGRRCNQSPYSNIHDGTFDKSGLTILI